MGEASGERNRDGNCDGALGTGVREEGESGRRECGGHFIKQVRGRDLKGVDSSS